MEYRQWRGEDRERDERYREIKRDRKRERYREIKKDRNRERHRDTEREESNETQLTDHRQQIPTAIFNRGEKL